LISSLPPLPPPKKNRKGKEIKDLFTTKIQIFPDELQQKILNHWLDTSRWIYNKSLDLIKSGKVKINATSIRQAVSNKKVLKARHLDWALDVPSDVRNRPIRELVANYKGNFTKGIHFVMKYRSKKWRRDTCTIEHKYWNKPQKNMLKYVMMP